ncbi:cytochrome-c peroxidase [Mergibacter septicus]|uniref:cytochrome-c peroxidase n=1 Tax=Mergibacter septicus TaxID=221402 RepID=UPI00117942B9|nr:cytochrome-c peroxidase [Mergibacter septicus]AWX13971.1 cytochrome-c peroxidase [Mergibacter septicus]
MKKKKLVLSVGAAIAIGFFGMVGYVHHFDKQQENLWLSKSESTDPQFKAVEKIFYQNGCQYCHSPQSEKPFYASLPIIKNLTSKDIAKGQEHFLLDEITAYANDPEKISTATLAKLERVILNNEMPLKSFVHLHWGSSLDSQEQETLLNWIREQRQRYHLPENTEGTSATRFVQPIPQHIPVDQAKVELGNVLFHSTALSGDGTISCATCHSLTTGGVDQLPTSTGIFGQKGGINAPTVYNAVFNFAQFWDGRAKDLADQAGGPPLNPIEMGSKDWNEIIDKLNQDENFKQAFTKVYPDGFTKQNITNAIAEFEKTLITPNSPFDRYLQGDSSALTQAQVRGYELFQKYKCDTCHSGVTLGGQSYELMGLKGDYFADRGTPITEADYGRYSQTQDPRDKFRFKVPNLRNIALTAPYFHDASAKDLHQAVEVMLKYQSGVVLPKQDVDDIVDFLHSLTGEYQGKTLTVE